MKSPKIPALPVLAGAIVLVLGASLILVGGRGDAPSAGPTLAPSPTASASDTPTPSATPSPTRTTGRPRPLPPPTPRRTISSAPGRCGGVDADFNRDGYADLVVGIPGEDANAAENSGAVNVMYGGRSGLSGRVQVFTQDSTGIEGSSGKSDRFGESLTTGDFNGDRYTDLAVGVPGEAVTGFGDGAVNVIYGSRDGLRAAGDQLWHQDVPGVPEEARSGDQFGRGLAAGDFDRDGYSDLAIGTPLEDLKREGQLSAHGSAGAVTILRGTPQGLTAQGAQLITEDTEGVPDDVEALDLFGWMVLSADFDRDGHCDLVVSAPGETVEGAPHGGWITVLHGSLDGIDPTGARAWVQGAGGVPGTPKENDEFGRTLASADFDGDGFADLALGAFSEDAGELPDTGNVTILHGSRSGLTAARAQVWHQDSEGIGDAREGSEAFGLAVTADDFNGDGVGDLAIGAPMEGFPPTITGEPLDPGVVHVIYGVRGRGLRSVGSQVWSQDSPGVLEASEHGDSFGISLGGGDIDGDGAADLIVGVPNEKVDDRASAGVVHVLFGTRDGVRATGNRLLEQGADGVPDRPDEADGFGTSTAAS